MSLRSYVPDYSGTLLDAVEAAFFWCLATDAQMNLAGRSREEIETALKNRSRADLLDLIYSLTTVEFVLRPSDIAARSAINKRAVLRDLRDGKFPRYFLRAANSILVPLSSVNAWRRRFEVTTNGNVENSYKRTPDV